jgi:arylsulfate sulfotransferase
VTMFGARHATEDASGTFLVIVDGDGDIVWYYDDDIGISDSRRLRNGNLLFLHSGNRGAREIDMLGNVVGEWTATGWDRELPEGSVGVATDSFHHEIVELPDDDIADFLVLSTELRPFSDYPLDVADPSQTEDGDVGVLGDTIVTFDRDGTIVEEWSLLDVLDPYRVSYDSLGTDWKVVYGDEDTRDWSHANAVVLDPEDGNLIVSLRNQDALIKVDRESGELMWILGDPDRWEEPWSSTLLEPTGASGDFEWSYHQHAPMFTPDGTIVLYDNGNGRAIPPEPELDPDDRYSRAVEYRIDDDAGTVAQVWAFGGPDDPWYSGALGDADHLAETGNLLVTDGFRTADDGGRWARAFEVTRTDPGEVVWEIAARGDEVGWTIYRAERLQSIYPGGEPTSD